MRKTAPAIAGFLAGLVPAPAFAFEVYTDWADSICGIIPCNGFGGGAGGLSDYVLGRAVTAMEIVFIAVAVLSLFFTTINMVMFSEQEEVVKQGRMNFVYGIAGAAVVSLARWFAVAFTPLETGSDLVDQGMVDTGIGNIIAFFKTLLSIILVTNIVIQGTRLIRSQGESEYVEHSRKRLINSFVGVIIVMLANTIAVSANPELGTSTMLAVEVAGITSYLITIIGFAAVVVIIAAGIALIVSADESLKDKAKTMIKVAIVALIAVLVSYALVTAFILF